MSYTASPTRFQSMLVTLFDESSARRHQIGPDTESGPKQTDQQKMEPSPLPLRGARGQAEGRPTTWVATRMPRPGLNS